jgi:hypothetical protein
MNFSPVEHEEQKGYYYIPFLNNVVINKNGNIIDLEHPNIIIEPKDSVPYKWVAFNGGYYHVHKLLAETFIEKPLVIDPLVVNHLDGIKINNDLKNLEWTTCSGNCIHAYQTGLRFDNTPILIKDLTNGEIQRFYSLQECARYFNVNGAKLHWYLKSGNIGKVCFKKYVIIHEDEEWPDTDYTAIEKHRNGQMKDVYVFDTESKQLFIYEGTRLAAELVGLKPGTLSMQLHRSLIGEVVIGKWIIRLSDGKATQEAIRITGNKLGRRDCNDGFRKPIQILVTEIESGTVSQWNSSEEFASSLNVSKNTLQKHLWVNNGIWKNQFRVEYLRT